MKKLLTIIALLVCASCGKNFLEYKYDRSWTTPSKLEHFRALTDNPLSLFNSSNAFVLSSTISDEYYIKTPQWENISHSNRLFRNAYVFEEDVFGDVESHDDWDLTYKRIMTCNLVLEGLEKLKPSESELNEWDEVYGIALFFRAFNYYRLAQIFCDPYFITNDDNMQLGVPLRTDSDLTVKVGRSTLKDTYRLIFDDLLRAEQLLPVETASKFRPSKLAVQALLARICLLVEDYDLAYNYARKVLSLRSELMDYRSLDVGIRYPFSADYGLSNPGVLFFCRGVGTVYFARSAMQIPDEFLGLFEADDLRKSVYFDSGTIGNLYYRGSFTGTGEPFEGLTVEELLLIAAEVAARRDDRQDVLDHLNPLKRMRFFNYVDMTDKDLVGDIILTVLQERQRELAYRGLRFEDLRRLNKDHRYAKRIVRILQQKDYILEPNDTRYTFPLPPSAVKLGGYEQNKR